MPRFQRFAWAIGAAALLATATGCTLGDPEQLDPSGTASISAVGIPDACSLLTAEQLEAATGHDFAPGSINADQSDINVSQCDWFTADGGDYPAAVVHVAKPDFTVAEQRDAADNFFGSTADADVPGGIDAFVTKGGQHVGMAVGPYWVMVSFAEDSTADLTDQTTELARAVAAALTAD